MKLKRLINKIECIKSLYMYVIIRFITYAISANKFLIMNYT